MSIIARTLVKEVSRFFVNRDILLIKDTKKLKTGECGEGTLEELIKKKSEEVRLNTFS